MNSSCCCLLPSSSRKMRAMTYMMMMKSTRDHSRVGMPPIIPLSMASRSLKTSSRIRRRMRPIRRSRTTRSASKSNTAPASVITMIHCTASTAIRLVSKRLADLEPFLQYWSLKPNSMSFESSSMRKTAEKVRSSTSHPPQSPMSYCSLSVWMPTMREFAKIKKPMNESMIVSSLALSMALTASTAPCTVPRLSCQCALSASSASAVSKILLSAAPGGSAPSARVRRRVFLDALGPQGRDGRLTLSPGRLPSRRQRGFTGSVEDRERRPAKDGPGSASGPGSSGRGLPVPERWAGDRGDRGDREGDGSAAGRGSSLLRSCARPAVSLATWSRDVLRASWPDVRPWSWLWRTLSCALTRARPSDAASGGA
mmetsp:Transcript_74392/g.217886  ORF Transcript_74392/g.217886 Transcript_74392/m.217886 type:complete len:369 (-) Transcript_74392:144-1250(-)